MRRFFCRWAVCCILAVSSGCEKYASLDDFTQLESRVTALENLCGQMNTNIASLQTLVGALQNNDYITSIVPIINDGDEVGYTITFTKSSPITIYHGKNGEKGNDGQQGIQGEQGQKGKDGSTPVIGIRKDTDGCYYWTLNEDWLTDENGNKIKAEGKDGEDGKDGAAGNNGQPGAAGKDGVTPQFKIENGNWYVSTNNGNTWNFVGRATGENGQPGEKGTDGANGDSMFEDIDFSHADYIIFTLSDGTVIKIPTWSAFETLQQFCNQMNTNIASLQTLVGALQNNDYITSIVPIISDGEEVGYTITFTQSSPVTIYHGKNGEKGNDGQQGIQGEQGQKGKDGSTPVIGIRKDTDGCYYWTLNEDWLTDEDGNKIKAEGKDGEDGKDGAAGNNGQPGTAGKDGVTPQFKIEDGDWYLSTDDGETWDYAGRATGEKGADGAGGDSLFTDINTTNTDYVVFTLSDGTEIKIPTWHAFELLQKQCNEMNTNIASLQSIVKAIEDRDYVVSCTPLMDSGIQIGYTLTFAQGGPVNIYHGKDGKDGQNGKDGKDGNTPQVRAERDIDGILYWMVDGEWLTDENTNKIPVTGKDGQHGMDGKDGITPQFKIENGDWFVSVNNGQTWTNVGRATGNDGVDGANGSSLFTFIRQDDYYVYIKLVDSEEELVISKNKAFEVVLDYDEFTVQPGETYRIGYTIIGGDMNTQINFYEKNGIKATLHKNSDTAGTIEVTIPSAMTTRSIHELIVLINNGYDRTLMKTLTFVKGIAQVTNRSVIVNSNDISATIPISTNLNGYTVVIPEDAPWLTLTPATRAEMREETIGFTIQPNTDGAYRSAIVKVVDQDGITAVETLQIIQRGANSVAVHVETAGTLKSLLDAPDDIEDLTITGTLNATDISNVNSLKQLKFLDLSGLSNTTLPSIFNNNKTIETILLPSELTRIQSSAFAKSAITQISIPQTVTTIESGAFNGCTQLKGNLIIPDGVLSIGSSAFENCGFDGTLTLGEALQSIGNEAFSGCSQFKGDLIIPDGVTSIGKGAFLGCNGFDGILLIGSGVQTIAENAFVSEILTLDNNYVSSYDLILGKKLNFSKIYCKASIPPVCSFKYSTSYANPYSPFGTPGYANYFPDSVIVPVGYKGVYKSTEIWNYFLTITEVDFDTLEL